MVANTQAKVQGFRIPKRTARLVFSGDYEGAEAVVRLDVPVGVFLSIQDLNKEGQHMGVFDIFGDRVLQEWNLETDDGTAIVASSTGMREIPLPLANLLIEQWVEVTTQPSLPLG